MEIFKNMKFLKRIEKLYENAETLPQKEQAGGQIDWMGSLQAPIALAPILALVILSSTVPRVTKRTTRTCLFGN